MQWWVIIISYCLPYLLGCNFVWMQQDYSQTWLSKHSLFLWSRDMFLFFCLFFCETYPLSEENAYCLASLCRSVLWQTATSISSQYWETLFIVHNAFHPFPAFFSLLNWLFHFSLQVWLSLELCTLTLCIVVGSEACIHMVKWFCFSANLSNNSKFRSIHRNKK